MATTRINLSSPLRWVAMLALLMLVAAAPGPVAKIATILLGGGMFALGMIMDSRVEFCSATALSTAATGLAAIGNVVDLTVARDIGTGRQMYLVIQVDTAVTSAGSATVSFQLVSDGVTTPAANGTETLHWASAAIPKATLVAGYVAAIVPLPLENPAYERYLGIQQNVGTAALTAGKINAFVVADPSKWKDYADGIA